jgi:glycosyltransferase involved in cell wall biosynthesis
VLRASVIAVHGGCVARPFISWSAQNGRTRDLAPKLGLDAWFALHPDEVRLPLLLRYLRCTARTTRLLGQVEGPTVAVMMPPLPLLLIAVVWAHRGDRRLIADLHTGFFADPKWRWATSWSLRLLRRHVVIVTNRSLADRCRRAGVRDVHTLHDPLDVDLRTGTSPSEMHVQRPCVVAPLSYASDEPVAELLEAARQRPEVFWYLTGRPPRRLELDTPPNVLMTGFLRRSDYVALLDRSVVVALVTRDETMQRSGYEAMMLHRPLVVSDWPLLQDFFGDAAVYTSADAESIAGGVQLALERQRALQVAMARQHRRRLDEQQASLERLRRYASPGSEVF